MSAVFVAREPPPTPTGEASPAHDLAETAVGGPRPETDVVIAVGDGLLVGGRVVTLKSADRSGVTFELDDADSHPGFDVAAGDGAGD